MHAWINSPVFVVAPNWGDIPKAAKPIFEESDANKKLYGVELAKGLSPYEAARAIFPEGQGVCVWVAQNWITEPVVIAAKDEYLQAIEFKKSDLDKDSYLATILGYYHETYLTPSGKKVYVNEGKDRLAALALYGKAKGYVEAKTEINNNINNNLNNEIKIVFVKPDDKATKTIDVVPNTKSEIENSLVSPLDIKLVKSG